MFRRLAGLLAVALFPLASLAQSAPPPPMPGYSPVNRHVGFFIRPEVGLSYLSTSASSGGLDLKLSGGGATLGLAIGGAVSEDFIVAGQVWDYVVSDPTVTLNGQSGTASGSSVGLVGYGVLLNWYFPPSNLYVAVTPSITRVAISDSSNNTGTTEWGFGLRAAVGKEWWVSDHWGLGLDANVALSSNKDSGGSSATFGSAAIGVSFSATYN
jgi:hypothetical protein